jgi:selenide,water dikinase
LAKLPQKTDANLLVGFETNDDAGVYRLNDDLAIVTTADIITPPLDDAYLFGQIAAANALSDVYAMGGKPLTCLNLAGFPAGKLPDEVLHNIIEGALSKITEAGAVLAGGHTTEDEEPKFGLAVTGVVHPQKVWRNIGVKPGDAIILTKPIGSGVLFNANLKRLVSEAALNKCIENLIQLNKTAAEIIASFSPHAVTDVTGFGLAGHAFEMAKGSQVCLRIFYERLPIMPEALEMYQKGVMTGVNSYNKVLVTKNLNFEKKLSPWEAEILFDPQTSGGLLVALPEAVAEEAVAQLRAAGYQHTTIIAKAESVDDDIYLTIA